MEVGRSGKEPGIRAGIIVQARMASIRLPGKVLMPVSTGNLFEILVRRLRLSGMPVILATSQLHSNDPLVETAARMGMDYYRGSEEDVLGRYYETAKAFDLQIIVRATGDNPLLDGRLVRMHVDEYIRSGKDRLYMSTHINKTFPDGLSFEIFNFQMLEEANRNGRSLKEREHVTPYFYTNPGLFDIQPIVYKKDKSADRLTVDTEDDFRLVKTLVEDFQADELGYEEIMGIMDQHPNLSGINASVQQKKWFE